MSRKKKLSSLWSFAKESHRNAGRTANPKVKSAAKSYYSTYKRAGGKRKLSGD